MSVWLSRALVAYYLILVIGYLAISMSKGRDDD